MSKTSRPSFAVIISHNFHLVNRVLENNVLYLNIFIEPLNAEKHLSATTNAKRMNRCFALPFYFSFTLNRVVVR